MVKSKKRPTKTVAGVVWKHWEFGEGWDALERPAVVWRTHKGDWVWASEAKLNSIKGRASTCKDAMELAMEALN